MEWKPGKEHYRWLRSQKYTHIAESHVDYHVHREGSVLYVLFQESDDKEDWASNLNFFPEAFTGSIRVHRGIYQQYQSISGKLLHEVDKEGVEIVRASGFSLGCALLQLFVYEALWRIQQNNLAVKVEAFGYDGPRVFCPNREVKKLLKNHFVHVKNRCDPVVHVPWKLMPTFFYFRWGPFKLHIDWKSLLTGRFTRWMDVGKTVWIGKPWPWPCKHLPEQIEKSLLKKFGR